MSSFHSAFLTEIKRRLFEESIPRTRKCLGMLSEEDIWHRPNQMSNSVGNLVLHLCGNARQWIISGFGREADIRQRQAEFDEKGPLPTNELLDLLDKLEHDLLAVFDSITEEELLKEHEVQVFKENGIAILVHVVEHFSYHVGQISYFVKAHKGLDTAYYGDMKL
ncbi:MAG: DUF1572 domain-containing protein [Bacteroidia bacterium]|nr:DUF1572 domain-containing protein [Bacteroidia bacterium]